MTTTENNPINGIRPADMSPLPEDPKDTTTLAIGGIQGPFGTNYPNKAAQELDLLKVKLAIKIAVSVTIVLVLTVILIFFHPTPKATTDGKVSPNVIPAVTVAPSSDTTVATSSPGDGSIRNIETYDMVPLPPLFKKLTSVVWGFLVFLIVLILFFNLITATLSPRSRARRLRNVLSGTATLAVALALPVLMRIVNWYFS